MSNTDTQGTENKGIKSIKLFDYQLTKDNRKVLKLNSNPNADEETKKIVTAIRNAIGGDYLNVNIFNEEFKGKYKVQDFVKGNVTLGLRTSRNQEF
jgi:hypothetical protein